MADGPPDPDAAYEARRYDEEKKRRHLVLEPVPGADVRRRERRVHAAAGGDGARAGAAVRARGGAAAPRRGGGGAVGPRRRGRAAHPGAGAGVGRGGGRAAADLAVRAQFVVLAGGVVNHPKVPRVPGLDDFAGPVMHTGRWDYGVSGGSPDDWTLSGLAGKRVGVVGTGATAVGCG